MLLLVLIFLGGVNAHSERPNVSYSERPNRTVDNGGGYSLNEEINDAFNDANSNYHRDDFPQNTGDSKARQKEKYKNTQCVHCSEYQGSSAANKEEIIYDKIVSTEYDFLGEDAPSFLTQCESTAGMKGIFPPNQFDRFSDERPEGFTRIFHNTGIVATVKWEKEPSSSFTGLFKGADHGVLRFSPLAPLLRDRYLTRYFLGTFLFSFGLKFFRDGMYSGNVLAGDSRRGFSAHAASRNFWDEPNYNIFSRPLDNMPGLGDQLGPFFGAGEKFSGILSLADFASYDQYGNEESKVKVPLLLHFRPNEQMKKKFEGVSNVDFRQWTTEDDETIPADTPLYHAYTTVFKATGEPSLCVDDEGFPVGDDEGIIAFCPDQKLTKVGTVITTSRFYVSKYSDDKLFFQHTRACKKDQTKCYSENFESNLGLLTVPDQTFADDKEYLCQSSPNAESTNILPSCPISLQALPTGDSCYPGENRQVEATQDSQCPMMNMVTKALSAPDGEMLELSCDFFYDAQFFMLDLSLDATSFVINLLPDVIIDNVIVPILNPLLSLFNP